MTLKGILRGASVLTCAGAIAACSSGSSSSPTGTVSVSLMDRPIDGVEQLWVTISEVWIKSAGSGPAEQLPMTSTPLKVDLLELNDQNASVLVSEAVVDAGSYNWIELRIRDEGFYDNYAVRDDGGVVEIDVDVPSNSIRLVSGFDVGPNQAVRLLFDWDVRKGLADAVGREAYMLRPAFRMLDVDEYGSISGSITIDELEPAGCAAINDATAGKTVYIYEGDVSPGEIGGGGNEPLTTADAGLNTGTGTYDYRTVVMPGPYTVALACNGPDDGDGLDGDITFHPGAGEFVEVTAATPVVVDF